MEPTLETSYRSPTRKPKKSIGFLIATFTLLLILVYVMSIGFSDNEGDDENVLVSKVDLLTAQEDNRLPSGFPSDIPVEVGGVYESYSMNYEDRGVKQYTVSFTASESFEAVYRRYADYLSQNEFAMEEALVFRNENPETLYATKENDDISIVIAQTNGVVQAQISYLDR